MKLDFDPCKETHGYDDLKRLGHCEDEWLRGGPVRRWVPKGLAGKPVYVSETGGSTGVSKARISITDFETDYELFSETLSAESSPSGSDWLMFRPAELRRLCRALEHLAQHCGGIACFVDRNSTVCRVGDGATGRVMPTRLTKEFFLPRLLARDRANAPLRSSCSRGRGEQFAPVLTLAGICGGGSGQGGRIAAALAKFVSFYSKRTSSEIAGVRPSRSTATGCSTPSLTWKWRYQVLR
ncbi:hypothetical protein HUU39_11935 [candidate division KSB1 bacterium]|nr:hypothetical protein [candidate division KSB1 bacterium]